MHLEHLWLTDFRSYQEAEFMPGAEGITVVSGANAEGKTNLLEAIGYLATLRSFRGSPAEAMVRQRRRKRAGRGTGGRSAGGATPPGRGRVARQRPGPGAVQRAAAAPDP